MQAAMRAGACSTSAAAGPSGRGCWARPATAQQPMQALSYFQQNSNRLEASLSAGTLAPSPRSPLGARGRRQLVLARNSSSSSDPLGSLQNILAELRADPVLRKTLDSPRIQRALQEVRENPQAAIARYARDPEVMAVLGRLAASGMPGARPAGVDSTGSGTGVGSSSGSSAQASQGSNNSSSSRAESEPVVDGFGASPSELASRIFKDPKLVVALQKPKIRQALAEIRADPERGMRKYEGDREVQEVLDMLEASMGVIDV